MKMNIYDKVAIEDTPKLEIREDTNVFGFKGPRKMTVLIPGICDPENYRRQIIRPLLEKDSILEKWKNRKAHDLIALHNKSPSWNEAKYIIMQFGRIDYDVFTMDFRYPLSALQAFGIAMTSFHGKIACE
ncbi:unnamed protein product [Onchocerca ochengi]|uniref:Tub domain-containing protein n=1 Tax=Onchocerca ochengi TaxID=42157 RepID=A0A182E718_ONCOC|nr:unnamed protein product [Onchocerca ochengi]